MQAVGFIRDAKQSMQLKSHLCNVYDDFGQHNRSGDGGVAEWMTFLATKASIQGFKQVVEVELPTNILVDTGKWRDRLQVMSCDLIQLMWHHFCTLAIYFWEFDPLTWAWTCHFSSPRLQLSSTVWSMDLGISGFEWDVDQLQHTCLSRGATSSWTSKTANISQS